MRGVTGYRLSDVMNGALAQLVPHRRRPPGREGARSHSSPVRSRASLFSIARSWSGTWGGRPTGDGNDGLANPCASIANISIEVAESNWPILIERYGLVPDSGGAGRFRGGLAVTRVWRATVPETLLQVRSDRQVHRPYGLNGGLAGTPSSNRLHRVDGSEEHLPPMFGTVLERGDVYNHRMPGGGGWGDPLDREPQAVAWDVMNEKVSRDAARDDYGVVMKSDGSVDDEATEALRRSRATLGSPSEVGQLLPVITTGAVKGMALRTRGSAIYGSRSCPGSAPVSR